MGKRTERTDAVIAGILRVATDTGVTNRAKLVPLLNDKRVSTPEGLVWRDAQALRNFINRYDSLKTKLREMEQTPTAPAVATTPEDTVTPDVTDDEVRHGTQAVIQPQEVESELTSHTPHDSGVHDSQEIAVVEPDADSVMITVDGLPEDDSVILGTTPEQKGDPVTHEQSFVIQLPPETVNELLEMLSWWRQERGKPMEPAPVEPSERPEFDRKKAIPKTIRLDERLVKDAQRYAKRHKAVTGGTFSGLVELLLWQCLGCGEEYLKSEEQAIRD